MNHVGEEEFSSTPGEEEFSSIPQVSSSWFKNHIDGKQINKRKNHKV